MKTRADIELPLSGGRSTPGVVRIGDTVRRPSPANAGFVHGLLRHLELRGFTGAPRYLGQDEKDREILSYIPGFVPQELGEFNDAQCIAAAGLLRNLHDATADCAAKGESEVICHGDPSPCNCVFDGGQPRAFVDFDAAHPGSRGDDLGYAAWLWLDFGNIERNPESQGRRLRTFASAYDPATTRDVLNWILAAQERRAMAADAMPEHRDWARNCLNWTRDTFLRLERALTGNVV